MKNEDRVKLLHKFAKELKEAGYKIYFSDSKIMGALYSYCFIVRDNNIGYMEADNFGEIHFCTVHKPCQDYGTGVSLNTTNNPTIVDAERSFNRVGESWQSTLNGIQKYKNWEEYISMNKILNYVEVQ